DWVRLALWKARMAARHALDAAGGHARAEAAGRRWAAGWRARSAAAERPLRDWLARPGGGEFWIPAHAAAEWARASCTPADLALARATAAGEFDLLGSGPVRLGGPPAWRRALYSGVEWPLEPSRRLRIQRDDGSDIRTVWELSR